MSNGEMILYTSHDGKVSIQLRSMDGSVWLSQAEMATLFDTTPQNITQHIRSIYEEGELEQEATCKDYLQVRTEGERQVQRSIALYRLEVILAVGYRVRSIRGTQFRQWATATLREYLVKGFVMDDERLKEPGGGWDYFDELLARIREIRASEKRFYQKVRDLFALSADYDPNNHQAWLFFQTVQNKMHWAVHQHTAAELVLDRANPDVPNMGLTTWKGSRVRKGDVTTAKNYLFQDEMEELDRMVVMFLDAAEDRAKRRQQIYLKDWEAFLDRFLEFNERPILKGGGSVSHQKMEEEVHDRYALFDEKRKAEEKRLAELEHEREVTDELKRLEGEVSKRLPKNKKPQKGDAP
jgi:hypothetical protein